MSDPKRWLDEGEHVDATLRRLLTAGRRTVPPHGAAERGWSDFLALNGMPPASPTGGAGPDGAPPPLNGAASSGSGVGGAGALGAAAGAGAVAKVVALSGVAAGHVPAAAGATAGAVGAALPGVALVKTFVLGAALGVTTVLGVQGVDRVLRPAPAAVPSAVPGDAAGDLPLARPAPLRAASPDVPAAADQDDAPTLQRRAPVPGPVEPAGESPPSEEAQRPLPGPSVATFPVDARERESLLKAEARDAAVAKSMISGGRATEALVLLGMSSERFKDGTLGQEREALIIEALVRSGQAAAASTRARAFLAAHPSSPLGARVKELVR